MSDQKHDNSQQSDSVSAEDLRSIEQPLRPAADEDFTLDTTANLPAIPAAAIVTSLEERSLVELRPGEHEGLLEGCQETTFGVIACLRSAGQGSRSSDEDGAMFVSLGGNDYLVSLDGLGGHGSGKLATDTAMDVIAIRLESSHAQPESGGIEDGDNKDPSLQDTDECGEPLDNAVGVVGQMLAVEYRMRTVAAEESGGVGPSSEMGLCLTAMQVSEGVNSESQRGHFVNIGDSRSIVVRDNAVHFETHDHSLVQEMLDNGLISEDEARTSNFRHIVTRDLQISAGKNASANPDVSDIELQPGDIAVLASDGLWDNFNAGEVVEMIAGLTNPYEIAFTLRKAVAHRVNHEGGKDDNLNIIVYVHGKELLQELAVDQGSI